MGKFKLAFGIHNHQPVGNFEAVFHQAHHDAYLPFLKLLASFDGLGLSLHQSGILWDWQKQAEPEFFELVGQLVDSGRVELMTG
ncbi:MAG: alpha-amylase, partial [Candidatus Zixiibacteriota bacterium]